MIRHAKPWSAERVLREHLREIRAEIRAYEAPSSLGPLHDARVRPGRDAHVARLRALEAETVSALAAS